MKRNIKNGAGGDAGGLRPDGRFIQPDPTLDPRNQRRDGWFGTVQALPTNTPTGA
ncbi:MAG: hypothetical protein ACLUI3_11475 [Christensenellales bacterium]